MFKKFIAASAAAGALLVSVAPAFAHTAGTNPHTSCASPQNAVNDTGGGTNTAPGQGALPGGDPDIRPGNANGETPGVVWGDGVSGAANGDGLADETAAAHDGCDGAAPPDGSNAN